MLGCIAIHVRACGFRIPHEFTADHEDVRSFGIRPESVRLHPPDRELIRSTLTVTEQGRVAAKNRKGRENKRILVLFVFSVASLQPPAPPRGSRSRRRKRLPGTAQKPHWRKPPRNGVENRP